MEITLPRVVGTRPAVAPFLVDVPLDLHGAAVVVDCRALLSGTPSFADELVRSLLVDRHAAELVVLGAGTDFAADLLESARDHRVGDRLHLKERAPA